MKYDSPLVSVIITTYGRPKFLKNAIESVLCQSYKNIEIIVVDDNIEKSIEREATENLIKNNFQTIKYIKNKENRGACFSRNVGINSSKGEYIAFLDDDDEFFKTKIEEQLKKFKKILIKEPKIAIMSCRMGMYDEFNKKIKLSKYNLTKESNSLKDFLEGAYIGGTSSLLLRKDALLDVSGFQEIESCQEAYLILKILEKGYLFSVINQELVLYRRHNLGSVGNGEKAKNGQIKYLKEIKKAMDNNLKNSKKAMQYYNYQLLEINDYNIRYLYTLIRLAPISLITLKGILKVIKRKIK